MKRDFLSQSPALLLENGAVAFIGASDTLKGCTEFCKETEECERERNCREIGVNDMGNHLNVHI